MPLVLSALHMSSSLGLWPLYRFGVILFCEVLLSMERGMTKKVIEEVQQVWSQVNSPSFFLK